MEGPRRNGLLEEIRGAEEQRKEKKGNIKKEMIKEEKKRKKDLSWRNIGRRIRRPK